MLLKANAHTLHQTLNGHKHMTLVTPLESQTQLNAIKKGQKHDAYLFNSLKGHFRSLNLCFYKIQSQVVTSHTFKLHINRVNN